MGLERTVAVLNGFDSVYACDTIAPILDKVISLSVSGTAKTSRSARIITDHLRASAMILGEKMAVVPSNVDQGYVLRRFIRRSIRHARMLGIKGKFCKSVAEVVVQVMKESYPELNANRARIFEDLEKEEEKFSTALEHGTKVLERMLQGLKEAEDP